MPVITVRVRITPPFIALQLQVVSVGLGWHIQASAAVHPVQVLESVFTGSENPLAMSDAV